MSGKMKLLKFVDGDAPQTFTGAELTAHHLSFKSKSAHASVAKAWKLLTSADATAALQGGYWLLDANNKPIAMLNEVILAVPDVGDNNQSNRTSHNGSKADRGRSSTTTCSSTPRGVRDEDIKGLDLRSKLGRQLERARAEYGTTYKTASKSARELMNAEEVTEKRHEKMKRDREAVAEAVESGEGLPAKKSSKRSRTE